MTNRNPYHNYGDLPKVCFLTDKIIEDGRNNTLFLPNMKRGGFKNWDLHTYSKKYGFNSCPTKNDLDLGKSVPSMYWTGELIPHTHTEKVRFHKDGRTPFIRTLGCPEYDPVSQRWIYHTHKGVMEYISKDIQSFWECWNDHRQVSCGLTHKDRWVIVGDFDIQIKENTIQELEEICSRSGIPHFTYLEEHLDTGHYQIGWILDEPLPFWTERQQDFYRDIKRYVSDIFGSDNQFVGWIIKNPNCVNLTRTYWFNDVVNKQELIQSLQKTHNDLFNSPSVKKETKEPLIEPVVVNDYKPTSYVDDETSRNCSLLNELRDWMREYIKEHKELPSHNETFNKGYEISVSLGKLTHKGTLPTSEILSVVNSVEGYFKNRNIGNEYSQRQRFGNLISGCKREKNILDVYNLWKKGYKTGQIQKELGLKRDVLNKYIRFVKDNQNLIEEGDIKDVIPKTIELSKINKTPVYRKLINDVVGRLSVIRNIEKKIITIY